MTAAIQSIDASTLTAREFHERIVPGGLPVVLRDIAAAWPVTRAGRKSPEALRDYLLGFDKGEPVRAMMGPPGIKGRFFYNEALTGFNFRTESLRLDAASTLLDGMRKVLRTMVAKQREIGERTSVVMEGRDIGTVVLPDAPLKVFIPARDEVRAARGQHAAHAAAGLADRADQLARLVGGDPAGDAQNDRWSPRRLGRPGLSRQLCLPPLARRGDQLAQPRRERRGPANWLHRGQSAGRRGGTQSHETALAGGGPAAGPDSGCSGCGDQPQEVGADGRVSHGGPVEREVRRLASVLQVAELGGQGVGAAAARPGAGRGRPLR